MEREKTQEVKYQPVSRSLVVSLASPDEIYQALKNKQEARFLKFYVGIKGNEEAERRLTFFGGKVEPNEILPEATQREVVEEGNFIPLGIPKATIIGQWQYSSAKSGPREVTLSYLPVLPNDEVKIGEGVQDIVSLNIDQLEELVKNGALDGIPLEGHLTLADNPVDEIEISEEDRMKMKKALLKGLDWMRHIEKFLRRRFTELNLTSEKEFNIEYQKILSRFMRRGLEVGIKRRTSIELQEDDVGEKLKEALNDNFLGKDILYYLPVLAQEGLDWSGLEETTDGVKVFVDFLRNIFSDFLEENKRDEKNFGEYLKSPEIPLEEKHPLIVSLNDFFREKLREVFNVSDEDLDKALDYINNFFRELSNEMKVADPNLTRGLYQDFTLINEDNNASYGRLLSLFLGYDTKKNTQAWVRTRFEAGRHLLLLFKSLIILPYYKDQINMIRNGKINLAIEDLFGPIVGEKIINLGNDNIMQVFKRKRNQTKEEGQDSAINEGQTEVQEEEMEGQEEKSILDRELIVDEKPAKTFSSFLRKSFEERYKDIKDFYSISLVLNLEVKEFSLGVYEQVVKELVSFLQNQFPDEKIEVGDLKLYGSEDFINQQQVIVDGKRGGSQSKRMVRGKTFIHLGEEVMELTIYPFITIEEKGFWGWLEKINDDKDYVVRRLLAGKNGVPSLYDLLFPPDIYPHHYENKLKADYYN